MILLMQRIDFFNRACASLLIGFCRVIDGARTASRDRTASQASAADNLCDRTRATARGGGAADLAPARSSGVIDQRCALF